MKPGVNELMNDILSHLNDILCYERHCMSFKVCMKDILCPINYNITHIIYFQPQQIMSFE